MPAIRIDVTVIFLNEYFNTLDRFEESLNYIGSEDGIQDLCHWIVTQGKDYYMYVWNNPDAFPCDQNPHHFFWMEADDVFEERFGNRLWIFNYFTGEFIA